MKKNLLLYICLLVTMSSCLNDDFMDVYPKDQQTEKTAFQTYDNFKTYSWGLYSAFAGYATDTRQTDSVFIGDYEADNMIKGLYGNEGKWAYGKVCLLYTSPSPRDS